MTFTPVKIPADSQGALGALPIDRIGMAMEAILIVLLAFMPLALGVVAAWSEMVVIGGATVLTAMLFVRLLVRPSVRFVWTWAYLPVAFFAMVAVLQLIPLPIDIVKAISPGTAEMKLRLLEGLGGSDSMTLSF